MTDMEELRPVPRERAILESFFTQLGMFSFDRAKDYVEKEKDNSRSAGAIWAALLAALAHLAAAEKLYHNMTFLGQKLGKSHPHELQRAHIKIKMINYQLTALKRHVALLEY